jgi:ABC-type Na+ efflux pump permease subunit
MKRNTGVIFLLAAVLAVLLLGACASTGSVSAAGSIAVTDKARGAAETQSGGQERMIVSQAFITIDVADVDAAVTAIADVARKHTGYVVSSGNRTVIRVEAGSLKAAMDEVTALGSVVSRDVQEQDVTKTYSDASLKLENAKAARARYLELLQKAENVEAALKVEKELERLNGEITLLESQLGNLAHLTQYATITVTLRKQVTPGPLGWIFYGLYKAIEWLFVWQ